VFTLLNLYILPDNLPAHTCLYVIGIASVALNRGASAPRFFSQVRLLLMGESAFKGITGLVVSGDGNGPVTVYL